MKRLIGLLQEHPAAVVAMSVVIGILLLALIRSDQHREKQLDMDTRYPSTLKVEGADGITETPS